MAWVKVPLLSTTADTSRYVYYGNAGAADQQNRTAVWDSSFKVVTHFKDASGTQLSDSTGNGNVATLSGGTAPVTSGAVGPGYGFDGSTGLAVINNSATWAASASKFTIEYWIKVKSASAYAGAVTTGNWVSTSTWMRQGNTAGQWAAFMPLANNPYGSA